MLKSLGRENRHFKIIPFIKAYLSRHVLSSIHRAGRHLLPETERKRHPPAVATVSMYSAGHGLPEIRELYSQPATVKGHFRTLRNCSPFPCFVHKDRWPPPESGNPPAPHHHLRVAALPQHPPPSAPRNRRPPGCFPGRQGCSSLQLQSDGAFARPGSSFTPACDGERRSLLLAGIYSPGSDPKPCGGRSHTLHQPRGSFPGRGVSPRPTPPTPAPKGLRRTAGGGD
nr:uncharacterized protein LOC131743652 [Kogia breviceps]